jgi:hypothetical protein
MGGAEVKCRGDPPKGGWVNQAAGCLSQELRDPPLGRGSGTERRSEARSWCGPRRASLHVVTVWLPPGLGADAAGAPETGAGRRDLLDEHAAGGLAASVPLAHVEFDRESCAAPLWALPALKSGTGDVEPLAALGRDVAVVFLLVEPQHRSAHVRRPAAGRPEGRKRRAPRPCRCARRPPHTSSRASVRASRAPPARGSVWPWFAAASSLTPSAGTPFRRSGERGRADRIRE